MWECRINLVLNGNRHREREFVIHWVPVLKLKENSGQEHLHASTITEAYEKLRTLYPAVWKACDELGNCCRG
jgi:hypothetical protein